MDQQEKLLTRQIETLEVENTMLKRENQERKELLNEENEDVVQSQ